MNWDATQSCSLCVSWVLFLYHILLCLVWQTHWQRQTATLFLLINPCNGWTPSAAVLRLCLLFDKGRATLWENFPSAPRNATDKTIYSGWHTHTVRHIHLRVSARMANHWPCGAAALKTQTDSYTTYVNQSQFKYMFSLMSCLTWGTLQLCCMTLVREASPELDGPRVGGVK